MSQDLTTSVLLLRGVNVGGKNKIGMADLKQMLGEEGFSDVTTLGVAGTIVLDAPLSANSLADHVEGLLPSRFALDQEALMALAFERSAFCEIVDTAPREFGANDTLYRYNVLFLKDVEAAQAMKDIEVRPGVDRAWPGPSVIYFRLPSLTSPDRNKSWLNRLIEKPLYQRVTIRNWNTTMKVFDLLEKRTAK